MLLLVSIALAGDATPPPAVAAAIAAAAGVPEPIGPSFSEHPVQMEGWATRLPEVAAHTLLREPPPALAEAGWTAFLLDESFGIGGHPDVVAFLPTTDPFAVVAAVGTDGVNYGQDNAAVVAFLRRVAATEPFVLTGAGFDYVSGRFTTPIDHPGKLARMFYKMCPDIVWQGTGTVAALRREMQETNELYCWWD